MPRRPDRGLSTMGRSAAAATVAPTPTSTRDTSIPRLRLPTRSVAYRPPPLDTRPSQLSPLGADRRRNDPSRGWVCAGLLLALFGLVLSDSALSSASVTGREGAGSRVRRMRHPSQTSARPDAADTPRKCGSHVLRSSRYPHRAVPDCGSHGGVNRVVDRVRSRHGAVHPGRARASSRIQQRGSAWTRGPQIPPRHVSRSREELPVGADRSGSRRRARERSESSTRKQHVASLASRQTGERCDGPSVPCCPGRGRQVPGVAGPAGVYPSLASLWMLAVDTAECTRGARWCRIRAFLAGGHRRSLHVRKRRASA